MERKARIIEPQTENAYSNDKRQVEQNTINSIHYGKHVVMFSGW
jgi:hypothetical protein